MSENYDPPPPPPLSPPPPPRSPFEGPSSKATVVLINHEQLRDRLKAPAVIMIVIASLAILLLLSGLFVDSGQQMQTMLDTFEPFLRESMEQSGQDWDSFSESILQGAEQGGIAGKAINFLQLFLYGLIIIGALEMFKGKNYKMSMAAAVISSIPCLSPCCCLGMIPGIWSLVVLMSSGVSESFE